MAASLQEVANAAYEIKETTKPISSNITDSAHDLGSAISELQSVIAGNTNSGPKAIQALNEAYSALLNVHFSIDSMNRSIDSFIDELKSK